MKDNQETSCCSDESDCCSPDKDIRQEVSQYYGETLQTSDDLQTNACCTDNGMPDLHKKLIQNIDDEILIKFYGCGSPIPSVLQDCTVLDLGCGTGRDAYLVSQLVGEQGKVIGIDMTDEQINVAQKHIDSQMSTFGFSSPNVDFRKGFIEDLASVNIDDNSIDVVISNCVINLSDDKQKVFSEIYRTLKDGGELYFSDVFASRRVPQELQDDQELYGECLSGALYEEDFRRMMTAAGFEDFRIVDSRILTIDNPAIEKRLEGITFYSRTIRAFKTPHIEDRCEDYGQVAVYLGGIEESETFYTLDQGHVFEKGRPMLVCGNTASMLEDTRLKKHFTILGNREQHFGLFPDCGVIKQESSEEVSGMGCC